MRVSLHLAPVAVAAAISAVSGIASADDVGLAPLASGPAGGPKSVVWVDAPGQTSSRTSTAAMWLGIGLGIVGTVQIPIGVAMLSSSAVCLEFGKRGGGNFGCGDSNDGTHRAGAILAGVGAAGVISGIGLTIWGASRKSQGTDVRIGLGSVSATYRF